MIQLVVPMMKPQKRVIGKQYFTTENPDEVAYHLTALHSPYRPLLPQASRFILQTFNYQVMFKTPCQKTTIKMLTRSVDAVRLIGGYDTYQKNTHQFPIFGIPLENDDMCYVTPYPFDPILPLEKLGVIFFENMIPDDGQFGNIVFPMTEIVSHECEHKKETDTFTSLHFAIGALSTWDIRTIIYDASAFVCRMPFLLAIHREGFTEPLIVALLGQESWKEPDVPFYTIDI